MSDRLSHVSAPPAVGFLGKLPARGDFVRQHVGERVGSELEQWLQKSTQNLYQAKVELPPGYVRFLFTAAGCDTAAVGVLVKSQDQVGRSFPLLVFTALPLMEAMNSLASLPLAHAAFFARAEALLGKASQLSVDALREGVLALSPPTAAERAGAAACTATTLRETSGPALLAELFREGPNDSQYYALYTLCAATAAVRSAPPPSAATVLDCPIAVGPALAAWLELARRRLTWQQFCPALCWQEQPASRLLLALGAASDQLLQFVAEPKHPSARLWPLYSQRVEAIARARSGLTIVAATLTQDPSISVDALWSVVTQVTV